MMNHYGGEEYRRSSALRSATRVRPSFSACDAVKEVHVSSADCVSGLLDGMRDMMLPDEYLTPSEWAEKFVVFGSPSDPVQGKMSFDLSPYLRDIVDAWQTKHGCGTKEITVQAPEQCGKSLAWEIGVGWREYYYPSGALIYYTSDDKAALVNETKFLPLLSGIPRFARALRMPNARNATQYRLPGGIINFGGVGSRISSISCPVLVADELDDWSTSRGSDPLTDLRKRSRAFDEAILFESCTPSGTKSESRIHREFLESSQGYYHLRCQGCGELTMRSCDVHNLKFAMDEVRDKLIHPDPIPDTIRLVCPKCGFEHVESLHRTALVQQGEYIHRFPVRLDSHPGFQFGLLACLMPAGSWAKIAKAQSEAGKTGSVRTQRYFDNSVRGLPYMVRKLEETCSRSLHIHAAPLPPPDKILYRFLSADTQADCFYYVVRGMDEKFNTYLLASGKADTLHDLERLIVHTQWYGGRIYSAIIDEGGHRQSEVRSLTDRDGIYAYKGNNFIHCHWKVSEDYGKLILGDAKYWRVELLSRMYASANMGNHYWYVTEEGLTDEYMQQMGAWHPNINKLGGDEISEFVKSEDAPDHLFDAEKMMCLLIDYSWERGIKPVIERNQLRQRVVRVPSRART